jgi:cadmium resistance protein CadD (predicted permease)
VNYLLVTIPTAVVVFAATNIDDLVVLVFLFMVARTDGRLQPWQVVAGQVAGIAVLIASAAIAAIGLVSVPTRWVGLLGLVPLGLGVWRLIGPPRKAPDHDPPASIAAGLSGVAGVAIINGADNITIYTPMFRHLEVGEILVTLTVFVAMIGSHLADIVAIRRISHRVVPIILIAIGAIILTQAAIG